jgi:signal transduction histidine kinase
MHLIELFKTATFRVAILFSLAVTVASSIVFLFIYWQIATFDTKRVNVRLTEEVARAVTEPEDRLLKALDLRLTGDLRLIDYAGLFDRDGKRLYGNIAVLPKSLPVDGLSHAVEAAPVQIRDEWTEPGIFVAARRDDGNIVLLGRSLYEVYALRRVVVQALLVGIVPAIALALITGAVFSWRSTRRLKAINQTILRIMHGDLHERLPTRKKKDDIDCISVAVNLMLDEIVRLLDQIKSVGDNIAHDLRAPLAVARLKLEGELAKGDGGLRRAARQTLADLDRAMTTVTALLRISEIEAGRFHANFKPVDLAEVCAQVFELYEPLAETKSIAMTLDTSSFVPINGDFDLLVEAVANLVDNAIKFTPPNAEVRIAAKMIAGQPTLNVADRGPGVALEHRDNIFKRFYRVHGNSDLAGNGLGLSMAATIFGRHGFTLRVKDNAPGAVFEIVPQRMSDEEPRGDLTHVEEVARSSPH